MAKIKLSELKSIIKEVLDEMDLGEMARTPGTGGAYIITPEGEELLKRISKTGDIPMGMSASKLKILAWLYRNKKEGNRVQKVDYAKSINKPQPAVNSLFNSLESEGYVSKEGYQSALKTNEPVKKSFDVKNILGDLDLDDDNELELDDE